MCAWADGDFGARAGCRHTNRPRRRTLPALFPNVTEPDVNGAVEILHEDEALIVVNKPAPLPMHAGGRFYRNTLQHILNVAYHPQRPHPAHRLDANTTGIVLVTRTRHFAGRCNRSSRAASAKNFISSACKVSRRKMCSVAMRPSARKSGRARFARRWMWNPGWRRARNFACCNAIADGTTLLEARPLTGRTNQIRVHLWHLGFPVCGDPVYLAEGQIGNKQTLAINDPPLCLHAWRIKFVHPIAARRVEFAAPAPVWAAESSSAEA